MPLPYVPTKVPPSTVMVTIGTNSDSFGKPPSINRYRQHTVKLIRRYPSGDASPSFKSKSLLFVHTFEFFLLISASATKTCTDATETFTRKRKRRKTQKELWPHDSARKYENEMMDYVHVNNSKAEAKMKQNTDHRKAQRTEWRMYGWN
jgi:hypothetical protein